MTTQKFEWQITIASGADGKTHGAVNFFVNRQPIIGYPIIYIPLVDYLPGGEKSVWFEKIGDFRTDFGTFREVYRLTTLGGDQLSQRFYVNGDEGIIRIEQHEAEIDRMLNTVDRHIIRN